MPKLIHILPTFAQRVCSAGRTYLTLSGLFLLLASQSNAAVQVSPDRSQTSIDQSPTPIIFTTFPIPLMVESETEGVFIQLTQEVIRRLDIKATIRVATPQRSINDLVQGRVAVLFPALDVFFVDKEQYSRSDELIYIKEDFLFTRTGDAKLTTVDDLKGRTVGLTRGYPYAREIVRGHGFKLDYSLSDEMCVQKLVVGRIDAFIGEEKSGLQAFESQKVSHLLQYDSAKPVSRQDVYYATTSSPMGEQLAERISAVLTAMKADGTFQKIMAATENGGLKQ